jgi:hypothetical protein
MQIDTKVDSELPENNPLIRELTAEEAALYWSTAEVLMEAAEIVIEYKKRNGDTDPETPRLSEARDLVRDASELAELIEEVAVWRKYGSLSQEQIEQMPLRTGSTPEFNRAMEGFDK